MLTQIVSYWPFVIIAILLLIIIWMERKYIVLHHCWLRDSQQFYTAPEVHLPAINEETTFNPIYWVSLCANNTDDISESRALEDALVIKKHMGSWRVTYVPKRQIRQKQQRHVVFTSDCKESLVWYVAKHMMKQSKYMLAPESKKPTFTGKERKHHA